MLATIVISESEGVTSKRAVVLSFSSVTPVTVAPMLNVRSLAVMEDGSTGSLKVTSRANGLGRVTALFGAGLVATTWTLGFTTNSLLVATAPTPSLTWSATAGSTSLIVTIPVHTPESNVIDVQLVDSGPLWPDALSVAALS